jgi:hypothetical protein
MKQDRHCTYDVTKRRIRATIFVVEKQKVLYIVNVCLALGIHHAVHMIHIDICDLPGSAVFFHIIS